MWSYTLLLGLGIAAAVALDIFAPEGTPGKLLIFGSLAVGLLGIVATTTTALRSNNRVGTAAATLLISTVACGAAWWFGGTGRPDGRDPNGPLGLWPADAACLLFWASGAALMLVLGFDRQPAPRQRTIVVILVFTGLVVAQSAVTVSGLWSTHILLILPLPQITIAAFAVALGEQLRRSSVQRSSSAAGRWFLRGALALLVVMPLIAFDLWVDYSYHRDLSLTGGA